ncbi:hypothetical protein CEXT_661171 [Caerostris extrusa]|uniref:Uncharacterized protein n=1 Tax=Caerostris extrusa TaxID=172846 RepID=A0AAV4S3Y5_CAEEX|nr:hypothetical protein CEXT_661171 [Caerostris extrusa]
MRHFSESVHNRKESLEALLPDEICPSLYKDKSAIAFTREAQVSFRPLTRKHPTTTIHQPPPLICLPETFEDITPLDQAHFNWVKPTLPIHVLVGRDAQSTIHPAHAGFLSQNL